jgi:hypothetical protein
MPGEGCAGRGRCVIMDGRSDSGKGGSFAVATVAGAGVGMSGRKLRDRCVGDERKVILRVCWQGV